MNPTEQAVPPSGVERRKHDRLRVSRVEVRVASQASFRGSYSRDLSLGGLFVRTRQVLAQGTMVVVDLSVEREPPVRLRGEVIRQERTPDGTPLGMAVRFFEHDGPTQDALRKLLEARQRPVTTALAVAPTEMLEALGEAEPRVLANLAHELQQRVKALEEERRHLRSDLESLRARVTQDEQENEMLREASVRLSNELATAQPLAVPLDDEPL